MVEFDDNAKARLKSNLRNLYDTGKVHLKRILRAVWAQLRIAGPPTLAWILKHKAPITIILLVLYILFFPRSVPERRAADAQPTATPPTPANATPGNTTPPSTQATTAPATTEPSSVIPLYSPDRPDFEPQWGLPADLKAADLQKLAHQVEKLMADTRQTMDLEQQYAKLLDALFEARITNLYWQRVFGRGFHDTSLPLDWYELVKDYNSLIGVAGAYVDRMAQLSAQTVTLSRLYTAQVRIIGGKVIVGDQLFVTTLQRYISYRLSYLQTAVPHAQNVSTRTQNEFQAELAPAQNPGQ